MDEVALNNALQPLGPRGDDGHVVIVSVLLRRRHHTRDSRSEFACGICVASRLHQTDRQRSSSRSRIEMVFANPFDCLLYKLLSGGDAGKGQGGPHRGMMKPCSQEADPATF